ncbi:TolC family protein [Modicisalibacter coralii]|uniref:TolC family protein n=1 Tax=Modicisalibacter coralii TaxID=2304602 RepID=UPI00193962A1|nr:TolC family protein [Halomonas coralii]
MSLSRLPLAGSFGLVLLLSACSALPPDNDYPAHAEQDITQVPDWSAVSGGEPATGLTELIGAPPLTELVDQALAANPSLQQTLLALRIRQAERDETGAERLPSVSAGLEASRGEDRDATVYTGSATISWELDLWHKLANGYRAAGKDVAEQRAIYQSSRDTLAAEVMQAWLEIIADRHAIAIEQHRLATLEKNERFILQRYRSGIGTLEDLASARQSAASSRASLAEYRESLAEQQRSLREMLGRSDKQAISVPDDYPAVTLPLAALPEQTLRRRPDLKAAYLAIQAEALRTRVAYQELLPSFSVQAALEDAASSPRAALLTDPVWSLLGQLTAPLYQGGELRARARAAELETARAYQAYRETLLSAVSDVENALGRERSLAERQRHIREALANARDNLDQYQRQYRAGLVGILDLLAVQETTYDLEARLDQLTYQRLSNRIDLGLALGLGVNE